MVCLFVSVVDWTITISIGCTEVRDGVFVCISGRLDYYYIYRLYRGNLFYLFGEKKLYFKNR